MNGVYLMPLVKIIEVVGGALLLANKYVNLAIVLLAPLVVNILAIHIFLDMGGLPMALALTVFTVILIKDRWSEESQRGLLFLGTAIAVIFKATTC